MYTKITETKMHFICSRRIPPSCLGSERLGKGIGRACMLKLRRLLNQESKVVGEDTSMEIYVKVKPNLVLEVPKDMVRRLRRGDDAFDDVRRADIQKNLLLTLDLTCWL